MPQFSIIVAIYRVQDYLPKCVESILNQTFDDFEVILVDDGSDDECPLICDKFAMIDDRVTVVHKKNGGLVTARKSGLLHAKGEYIFNVDGDDWLEKNALEILYGQVIKSKPEIIMFNYYEGVENRKKIFKQPIDSGHYIESQAVWSIKKRMLYNLDTCLMWDVRPNIWCKVFRKDIALHYQLKVWDSISFGEDAASVYPMLVSLNSILIIDDALYNYRVNPNSMVRSFDSRLFDKTKLILEYLHINLTNVNIREQLPYYGVLMLENLLKNELRNESSLLSIRNNLINYCDDPIFTKYINDVELSKFILKHKLIVMLIKRRRYLTVTILFKVMSRVKPSL